MDNVLNIFAHGPLSDAEWYALERNLQAQNADLTYLFGAMVIISIVEFAIIAVLVVALVIVRKKAKSHNSPRARKKSPTSP